MDPVTMSSVATIGAQHGFNALLVVILLVGGSFVGWRVISAFISQIKELAAEHRAEREARDKAHVEALGDLGRKVDAGLKASEQVADEVRELQRCIETPVGLRRRAP